MSAKSTTLEFIKKAKKVHGDLYDYSLLDYINCKTKVKIICLKHGVFFQSPSNHLTGYKCSKCKSEKLGLINSNTQEDFLNKANLKHNYKYDYSLVNYSLNKYPIKIICPEHGEFQQIAAAHLAGKGCKLCAFKRSSKRQSATASWSYTDWETKGKNSKNYTGFKVYVLKCYNETETFYKIGKTFKNIEQRFYFKKRMPYNYKIIKEVNSDNGVYISKLENKLHNNYKNYKYKPLIKFPGDSECFSELPNLQIPRELI